MKHHAAPLPTTGPGLYVHVPFCEAVCSYCDFYSVAWGSVERTRYLDALEVEAERRAPEGFRPWTVFIGGGTPSSLAMADLDRLLQLVNHLAADGSGLREWTVENNPNSLTPERAKLMVEAGVTRLSIGVQSFDDAILRSVGRVHDAQQARKAVGVAREAGVAQVSIDLLFALPGQGFASFRRDLDSALELEVDHISAYALLYEPGTVLTERLSAGKVVPEEEDVELAMLRLAEQELGRAGFERYEVSNFARPGAECLHNLNYWRNGDYLGLGPSAASFLHGERRKNVPDWRAWEQQVLAGDDPCVESERLEGAAALGESLMLGLRLREGVDLAELSRRHGVDAQAIHGARLDEFRTRGWIETMGPGSRLRLTRRGVELTDGIVGQLIA